MLTIEFEELLDALAATPLVLGHRPSAVEVMDRFILDHARESPALDALRRSILQTEPGALLCVEFYADAVEDLPPRLDALERDLAASRIPLSLARGRRRQRIRRASGASARRRSACRWR